MERIRQWAFKPASGSEGSRKTHKHKPSTESSSDSCSYHDAMSCMEDNMFKQFTPELREHSSRGAAKKPKEIEESDEEKKSHVNPPRFIPRLLCFQGMPTEHRSRKKQKGISSDIHQQNNVSSGIQPIQESLMAAQRQLLNAYEEVDPPRRISSKWDRSSVLSKHDLAFLRQRLAEARLEESMESKDDTSYPRSCLGGSFRPTMRERSSIPSTSVRHGSSIAPTTYNPNGHNEPLLLEPHRHKVYCKSFQCPSPEKTNSMGMGMESMPMNIVLLKPNRMPNPDMPSSSRAYQDVTFGKNRSTLGEMLSIPECRVDPRLNSNIGFTTTEGGSRIYQRSRLLLPQLLNRESRRGVDHDLTDDEEQHVMRIDRDHQGYWRQKRLFQEQPSEDEAAFHQILETEQEASGSSTYEAGSAVVPKISHAWWSTKRVNRLGAELNELRMQLQLLKMDSAANSRSRTFDEEDLSMLISDEDHIFGAEGWEAFYALDVLLQSGLHLSDLNLFTPVWRSSGGPLRPMLFDTLENKYSGDNVFGLKRDRKLMFNRINAALFQVLRCHVDFFPWVIPMSPALASSRERRRVMEGLNRVISQKSRAWERVVDKETVWSDYRGAMDQVGREVERMVFDDLVNEFIFELISIV